MQELPEGDKYASQPPKGPHSIGFPLSTRQSPRISLPCPSVVLFSSSLRDLHPGRNMTHKNSNFRTAGHDPDDPPALMGGHRYGAGCQPSIQEQSSCLSPNICLCRMSL